MRISVRYHDWVGAGDLESEETRQERREGKLRKRREKLLQHGRAFVRAYKDAILKRARQMRRKGAG